VAVLYHLSDAGAELFGTFISPQLILWTGGNQAITSRRFNLRYSEEFSSVASSPLYGGLFPSRAIYQLIWDKALNERQIIL
jgi:hypothetical protein